MNLPKPEVVRCYFEQSVEPPLPAMELRWDAEAVGAYDRVWHLPENLIVKGPAPQHFGVTIHRLNDNSYKVRVLWNHMRLSWDGLTRMQIMTSSLTQLLGALGTDIWYMLNQPVEGLQQAA